MFLLRGIDGLFDRFFTLTGALALSQVPHLINQYIDVLSGALAESHRNLESIRTQAARLGRSLTEFIDKHLNSTDADFQASGRIMQQSHERFQNYNTALEAFDSAGIWEKPIVFIKYLDWELLNALQFEPAVPLTPEGAIYAFIGMLLGLAVYHGIIKLPVYIFRKKDDQEEEHGNPKRRRTVRKR